MTDPALDTALDLVNEAICECAHLKSEHSIHGACHVGNCTCREFRAVSFFVCRADARDLEDERHCPACGAPVCGGPLGG